MGGDAEIASLIVNKKIDGVIFFIDPLEAHPHQVDVNMLLRICILHNTPLAYPNPTAGTLFLTEQGDVSLKDLTGNIRLKLKNTKQLDMSSLPAGIYFLQYEGSSTKAYKVVKE
jgi:methylglyoxal synthase